MKKVTIGVVGSSGFLGKNLLSFLKSQNYKVIEINRKQNSSNNALIIPETCKEDFWRDVLNNIDVLVCVAGYAHQSQSNEYKNRLQYENANHKLINEISSAAISTKLQRIIFISSASVYGKTPAGIAIDETFQTVPISLYGSTKLKGEQSLKNNLKGSSVDYVILRPVMICGKNAPGNLGAVNRLLKMHFPLPVASLTKNKRSFVDIGSVCSLIEICIFHTGAANETFNVSNKSYISSFDFFRYVRSIENSKSIYFWFPRSILRWLVRWMLDEKAVESLFGDVMICSQKAEIGLGWSSQTKLKYEVS